MLNFHIGFEFLISRRKVQKHIIRSITKITFHANKIWEDMFPIVEMMPWYIGKHHGNKISNVYGFWFLLTIDSNEFLSTFPEQARTGQ